MSRLVLLFLAAALAMTQAIPTHAAGDSANIGVIILRADPDFRLLMAPGQTIRLAVAIDNLRGGADAPDTTLMLTVPDGLSVGASTPAAHKSGNVLSWTIGNLPAGSPPGFVELYLWASPDLAVGTAPEIVASVTTRGAEVDLDNNRDVMPIRIVTEATDLVVRSNLDHVSIFKGQEITASILVTNSGVVTAPSSTVTLTLPNQVRLVSADPPTDTASGNTAGWSLGDIAPGGGRNIVLTLALDPALSESADSHLDFVIEARSSGTEAVPENNRLELKRTAVEPTADLKVWLSLEQRDGNEIIGRITYGNFGWVVASPVSLSLQLDPSIAFVASDPAADERIGVPELVAGRLEWKLGWLGPGEADVMVVKLHGAGQPADGGAKAEIASPVPEAAPDNNSASARAVARPR